PRLSRPAACFEHLIFANENRCNHQHEFLGNPAYRKFSGDCAWNPIIACSHRCGSMVGYHETSRRTTRPGSTRPARRPRGRRPRPVDAVAPRQAGGEEVKAMARAWEPEFIRLWEAGATQADIAAALGIAAGTARSRAYTLQQEGKLALRPRGGRREPRAG